MKRSKRTLLILVSVICIALFGALSANATEDNDTLGEFVRIQCEAGEIDENLGDDTVLSDVYDGIESRILSGESTAEVQNVALHDFKQTNDYAVLKEATNDAISIIEDGRVEEIISDELSAVEKKDVVVETAVYDNLSYEHTEER